MSSKKKYFVAFAGPVGSSKTPISFYLSGKFGLPMYNTDAIRTEVIEDFSVLDEKEFKRRRDERLGEIMRKGDSFILDASIDRILGDYEEAILKAEYEYFIISMDLGKELLTKLYKAKNYTDSLTRLDQLLVDHSNFLNKYGQKVGLHITDKDFPDRLRICEEGLAKWLNNND